MHIAKGGFRKDLGIYVRSKMEANIARYYTYIGINWFYEPREYKFEKIKRGTKYYKPDFYLAAPIRLFIEVKGFLISSDKTKLRRFKKYYPDEFFRLRFIIPDKYSRSKANGEMIKFLCDDLGIDFNGIVSYKEIEKYSKLIPEWE
ncbi:hypothetical protein ES705_45884 [subsurface metagenome]